MKTYKSYAKVNIFLKVTGKRGSYHEIVSRFCLLNNLYDVLYFQPKDNEEFVIDGDFSCDVKSNTIFKAYIALRKYTKSILSIKTTAISNIKQIKIILINNLIIALVLPTLVFFSNCIYR